MNEELDLEAGEYVLGTLPAEERARFARRLETDADLQASVRAWRARLAPLDETASPETPSAAVWHAVERATSGGAAAVPVVPTATNVIRLERRLSAWRSAALAAGALAAGLAAVVVIDLLSLPASEAGRYVAVVDSGGHEPALIAEVDTVAGVIRVRSIAAEVPAGHSLELWHVADGGALRSLGLLELGAGAQTIQDAVAEGPVSGIIAVSVEPAGGSPSGAPTGDIVYTGRLIPVE